VNITGKVQDCVKESGVKEGLVLVNSMHISSSIFINDHESGLLEDWERWLEKLAPEKPHSQYRHNDTGEDNADAHLKRTIMGREVVVAITGGQARLRPVGTNLLRRIRRPAPQARPGENHRGIVDSAETFGL
jgi:secondary thiamine-phosphate synthase enzyme